METRTEWAVEIVWHDDTVTLEERGHEKWADSMIQFAKTKTIDEGGLVKSVTKKKRIITVGDWEDA